MKLCVFQGTFNPIHNAHLKMAEFALNNYHFDKIMFIPAHKPPHKDYDINISNHRYKMVELATEYNPNFIVSDIEFKEDRTSYTYLTIQELYKKYNIDDKINFIIGTDAFNQIYTWYEAEKLKQIVHFIVFDRNSKPNGENYTFAPMEFEDVSSTDIRERIKQDKDITNLVPEVVKEYIEKYGLYKNE